MSKESGTTKETRDRREADEIGELLGKQRRKSHHAKLLTAVVTDVPLAQIVVDDAVQARQGDLRRTSLEDICQRVGGEHWEDGVMEPPWVVACLVSDDGERVLEQQATPDDVGTASFRYVLADGYHRRQVAEDLGAETIRVQVIWGSQNPVRVAHLFSIRANDESPKTAVSDNERRQWLRELREAYPDWTHDDLAKEVGYNQSTVTRLLTRFEVSRYLESYGIGQGAQPGADLLIEMKREVPDARHWPDVARLLKRERWIPGMLPQATKRMQDLEAQRPPQEYSPDPVVREQQNPWISWEQMTYAERLQIAHQAELQDWSDAKVLAVVDHMQMLARGETDGFKDDAKTREKILSGVDPPILAEDPDRDRVQIAHEPQADGQPEPFMPGHEGAQVQKPRIRQAGPATPDPAQPAQVPATRMTFDGPTLDAARKQLEDEEARQQLAGVLEREAQQRRDDPLLPYLALDTALTKMEAACADILREMRERALAERPFSADQRKFLLLRYAKVRQVFDALGAVLRGEAEPDAKEEEDGNEEAL